MEPFSGCIKNLKLDSEYVNLNRAKTTKGVQNSCPNKDVRIISLTSKQSFAKFNNLHIDKEIEFSLRFRIYQSNSHVATVTINDVWFKKLSKIIRLILGKNYSSKNYKFVFKYLFK